MNGERRVYGGVMRDDDRRYGGFSTVKTPGWGEALFFSLLVHGTAAALAFLHSGPVVPPSVIQARLITSASVLPASAETLRYPDSQTPSAKLDVDAPRPVDPVPEGVSVDAPFDRKQAAVPAPKVIEELKAVEPAPGEGKSSVGGRPLPNPKPRIRLTDENRVNKAASLLMDDALRRVTVRSTPQPAPFSLTRPEGEQKTEADDDMTILASIGATRPSDVYSAPLYRGPGLNNPFPAYPRMARRKGQRGQVMLKAWVDENGLPERVAVFRSSGHPSLDKAALAAVAQWRFVPARRGGIPSASEVQIPITFRLTE